MSSPCQTDSKNLFLQYTANTFCKTFYVLCKFKINLGAFDYMIPEMSVPRQSALNLLLNFNHICLSIRMVVFDWTCKITPILPLKKMGPLHWSWAVVLRHSFKGGCSRELCSSMPTSPLKELIRLFKTLECHNYVHYPCSMWRLDL